MTRGSFRQPELGRKARIPRHHLVEARTLRLSRIRLSLSLRTLLMLILVIALWLSWRVDKAHRQSHAIAQVEKYNGYVRFDYEYVNGKEIPNPEPKGPKWLRQHLGEILPRGEPSDLRDQPLSDATLARCGAQRSRASFPDEDVPREGPRRSAAGASTIDRGPSHLRRDASARVEF